MNPRQQYSATPYVSTTQDMVAGRTGRKAGLDVYWRPSSNFQLTSTLNPDFGNVEADDVIVNLTRYETFFPEKRLFFQEGQEIFTTNSRFMADTVMLHTRRIGSAPLRPDVPDDVVVDASEFRRPSDILGALKATGQQGAFRFGLLGAAEDEGEFQAVGADGAAMTLTSPGRDYGAARLLYEHANGGYQALGWMSTAVTHPNREAYVHAVDGHFVSPGGTWTADAQVMQSDIVGGERGEGGIVDINFMPSKGQRHMLSVDVFDDKVDIRDMGFLRRNDLRKFRYRYRFSRSGMERLREVRTYLFTTGSWNGVGRMVGAGLGVDQRLTLSNLSQVRFTGDLMPQQYDDWSSPGRVFRVGGPVEHGGSLRIRPIASHFVDRAAFVGRGGTRRRNASHTGLRDMAAQRSADDESRCRGARSRRLAAASRQRALRHLRGGGTSAQPRFRLLPHGTAALPIGAAVGGHQGGRTAGVHGTGLGRRLGAADCAGRDNRQLRPFAHELPTPLPLGTRAAVGFVRGVYDQCRPFRGRGLGVPAAGLLADVRQHVGRDARRAVGREAEVSTGVLA